MHVQQCASAFKLLCSDYFYGLKNRLYGLFLVVPRIRSFFICIRVKVIVLNTYFLFMMRHAQGGGGKGLVVDI